MRVCGAAERGGPGGVLLFSPLGCVVARVPIALQRIPCRFKDRTLPHFSRFDVGPDVRVGNDTLDAHDVRNECN